jgi:hypothetical protein
MDFSDKELKVLLQALYRFRGEVSGATQAEQNKFGSVQTVIGKIEAEVGPLRPERTRFDLDMEESLSVLKTGHAGVGAAARGKAKSAEAPEAAKKVGKVAKAKAALDKGAAGPKVKKGIGAAKAGPARKAK